MRYNCNSNEEQSILKQIKEIIKQFPAADRKEIEQHTGAIHVSPHSDRMYDFVAPHTSDEHGDYYLHGTFERGSDSSGKWIYYYCYKAARSAI